MPDTFDKKSLSETDIRTKYITPAIVNAGWSSFSQMREEYPITKGRIIARGKTCKREKPLKADYVLFYKPNKPIAIVEAKDNNHTIGDGMQQALNYATMMEVPFVFSSNGDGFLFHNKYITEGNVETTLNLDEFPSPETLWQMYHEQNHVNPSQDKVIDEPYYSDNPDYFVGHGYWHRKNVHSISDYLAFVEGWYQKADSLPCRPYCPDFTDIHQ